MATNPELTPTRQQGLRVTVWVWIPAIAALALMIWLLARYA